MSEQLILDILSRNDPFGLMEMDCPDDEYMPEVEEIVSILDECHDVDELNQRLIQIFEHWFYTIKDDEIGADQKQRIKQCSIEIWESINQ